MGKKAWKLDNRGTLWVKCELENNFNKRKGEERRWKTYFEIIDESGQIRHLLSRGDSGLRTTKFRGNLFIRVVARRVLAFQKIQPHLIWSPITLDMNKIMKKGWAVIPTDWFSQVDKMTKFSHIKGKLFFSPFYKVCNVMSWSLKRNKLWLKLNSWCPLGLLMSWNFKG
jgi:hypothetical protein